MGFFYAENKAAPKRVAAKPGSKAVIPIATLRQMGCQACPRDKDAEKLQSPKMKPSGSKGAPVYLLGTSPSELCDAGNDHWLDKGGEAIYQAFGAAFMKKSVRSNYITQCRGDQTEASIECCRGRIVADIEATKPVLVVTVGDAPLQWVGGKLDRGALSALDHRGELMVAKFGTHTCYVLPIIYPNYAFKKNSWGKSEWEIAMGHDIDLIKRIASGERELEQPRVYTGNYDEGIEYVRDLATLERRLADMAALPYTAIDYEANGLRPFRIKNPMLLTAAIGTFEHTIAFPVMHPDGWDTKRQFTHAAGLLGEFLLYSGRKIAHNLSMEMEWTNYFYGDRPLRLSEWEDTMAQTHTLDERKGTKSLEVQSIRHFGFNLKAQSPLDVKRLLEYPIKEVLRYNGMDSKWTHKLFFHLRPRIEELRAYEDEYERKIRLAPTLVLTEARGLPVSVPVAKKMAKDFSAQAKELEDKILRTPEVKQFRSRFGVFSPTAPELVLKLMRDVCKRDEVRVVDRDGKESFTTGEEVLSAIPADEVPSAPMILEHRGVVKLEGTYLEPVISGTIVDRDGILRCKYSSMVAETGRLNSDDSNMQNWPKRKFKEVRRVMTTDGWVLRITWEDGTWVDVPQDRCFLACDYGQIEFRVVGMASEDPNIVKACWTGYDVHKFWAERLVKIYPRIIDRIVKDFKIDWDKAGIKTLRQDMKNMWVFPQLFGSSTRSCAANLMLPEDVADDLAAEFWDEFRVVKKWQDREVQKYEKRGYVETLGGRRRRGALSKNQIINVPIQGTAADIVTEGMNAISERSFLEDDPDLHPNLNVHDDLTFLPPINALDRLLPIITEEMCKPRFSYINVPLMVEASIGNNWCDLEEIGKFRSDEIFKTPNPYKREHA